MCDEESELLERDRVQAHGRYDCIALDRTVFLVRRHRNVDQLDKILEVRLRLVESLQLIDGEPVFDAFGGAVAVRRECGAVRVAIRLRARCGQRKDALV